MRQPIFLTYHWYDNEHFYDLFNFFNKKYNTDLSTCLCVYVMINNFCLQSMCYILGKSEVFAYFLTASLEKIINDF